MTGKVIFGALLSVVGILFSLLGIIFLMGSMGQTRRLAIGALLGCAGLAALIIGVLLFRKGIRFTPAGIRRALLRLARKSNGELTDESITGALGDSDLVRIELRKLVEGGVAREMMKNNRRSYLFADFQVKLAVKQCPYCGNDYPVRDDIESCPTCGGDLKMERSAVADSGDAYSMDDDDIGVS